jgi:lipopolysaccharide/colanic/teichoic acid biosynthesis glycosyltransferase
MIQSSLIAVPAERIKGVLWEMPTSAFTRLKRWMDVSFSLTALVVLSPLFLIIAALIKRDSTGNIFYKQERVGLHGVTFSMWKFRSMMNGAENEREALESSNEMASGVLFKIKNDPRITNVGRIIRRTSIDELPQLFNVLIGDMSLVGPRPPLMSEVQKYKRSDLRRLEGIPGLTCIWQVSGRSNIPFEQQVEMDVEYIRKQSLWLDLTLIIKTIPAVVFARGAY